MGDLVPSGDSGTSFSQGLCGHAVDDESFASQPNSLYGVAGNFGFSASHAEKAFCSPSSLRLAKQYQLLKINILPSPR
jgi:hypothetical protein